MLQFISDNNGETTGVFIPIEEWKKIIQNFPAIDKLDNVPEWQKDLVRKQKEEYKNNPDSFVEFDTFMDEVEETL